MIDAASTIAGLIVGGGLGTIAGGLFAAGKVHSANLSAAFWEAECTEGDDQRRYLRREIAELRAWKIARLAPLRKANAARKKAKIDRDNASRALRNARHAEMRAELGELV